MATESQGYVDPIDAQFQYQRRKPEQSVLYQTIAENLETFLATATENSADGGFPSFVEKEMRRFLD